MNRNCVSNRLMKDNRILLAFRLEEHESQNSITFLGKNIFVFLVFRPKKRRWKKWVSSSNMLCLCRLLFVFSVLLWNRFMFIVYADSERTALRCRFISCVNNNTENVPMSLDKQKSKEFFGLCCCCCFRCKSISEARHFAPIKLTRYTNMRSKSPRRRRQRRHHRPIYWWFLRVLSCVSPQQLVLFVFNWNWNVFLTRQFIWKRFIVIVEAITQQYLPIFAGVLGRSRSVVIVVRSLQIVKSWK